MKVESTGIAKVKNLIIFQPSIFYTLGDSALVSGSLRKPVTPHRHVYNIRVKVGTGTPIQFVESVVMHRVRESGGVLRPAPLHAAHVIADVCGRLRS